MEQLIPQRGGYRKLLSYRKAEAIYDITYLFCHTYLRAGDRTVDQMVQAARSGKQNIAEGSAASATSSETELKLLNVARASLQELLIDYENYLRVRGLSQWSADSPEAIRIRNLGREHDDSAFWVERVKSTCDVTIANVAIVLIHQADYLLSRQLEALGKKFLTEGGFRERMYRMRSEQKAQK